jgi:hypothetical protein
MAAERDAKIHARRIEGFTLRAIARELKLAVETVRVIAQAHGTQSRVVCALSGLVGSTEAASLAAICRAPHQWAGDETAHTCEAQRIAVNIARLPELLTGQKGDE